MKIFTYTLLFLFSISLVYSQNHSKIDSLESQLQKNLIDTIRIEILNHLGWKLKNTDPVHAIDYINQAITLADKIGYKKGLTNSYSHAGVISYSSGKFEESIKYLRKALNIAEEMGNKMAKATILNHIGIVHYYKGDLQVTLDYFIQSLKIKEVIQDNLGISNSYNNIGLVYYDMKNNLKAMEYFENSLRMNEELGDQDGIATCIGNIGMVYNDMGNIEKALQNYTEALNKYEELGNKREIARILNNIATIYSEEKKYDETLQIFQKSLKICEELSDKRGMALSLNNIGGIYLRQEKYKQAIEFSKKSLLISKEMGAKDNILEAYVNLSNIYSKQNNYKEAFYYFKLSGEVKDSILNEQSAKSMQELQTKYETEKKEKEIALLNSEKDIQALEVAKQKTLRNSFVGGLVLALALAFLLFNRYRIKQKANQQLNEAYNKLKQLEEFKKSMTGMIVHDLKNPLNSIIGLTGSSNVNPNHIRNVNQAGKQMLNMVMNMLDVQKFEDTNVQLALDSFNINKITEDALSQVNLLIEQKGLTLENKIGSNYHCKLDYDIITRVIVNILTNAIKYTPSGGVITLNAEEDNHDIIKISITDTGAGIPADKIDTIFEKFSQVDAKKSGQARSTGLGLTFCKMVVEAHDGSIWVESKEGEGTTFHFTLTKAESSTISKKETPVPQTTKQEEITLTAEEKEILKPIVEELKKYDVYDASSIMNVLNRIDALENTGIEKWASDLETAVFNSDNETFKQLLNSIDCVK